MKRCKIVKITVVIFVVILLVTGIGTSIYVNDYYHANSKALELMNSTDTVTVKQLNSRTTVFEPKEPKAGIIFYPGGKVEHSAYAPLLQELAKQGILGVLVKMPGNLAVLDTNAADGLKNYYPEVKKWYLGGHSLGGTMAASYIGKHADEYTGLILLAAYSTVDLSNTQLHVISIYGSCDKVLNKKKAKENCSNLPAQYSEQVIEGGCHAYFGMYGEQEGDGIPQISDKEQIEITAKIISNLI
ncbi:MAG: alpha/beta hydrolase [Clostridium sp.]|nr:alpha/beta hydrolase [Clostridium sp.]